MKEPSSGVVRTPPKSETIALISVAILHDLVMPEALSPLDRPAEEGEDRLHPRPFDLGGADQRPRAAQRLAVLAVHPQLEGGPALYAVGAVLGGEQRLRDLD